VKSVPDSALPPAWSLRLIAELDHADRRAKQVAGALSPEVLNWKPRHDKWSIGQCLHHLALANEIYLPPIDEVIRAARGTQRRELGVIRKG